MRECFNEQHWSRLAQHGETMAVVTETIAAENTVLADINIATTHGPDTCVNNFMADLMYLRARMFDHLKSFDGKALVNVVWAAQYLHTAAAYLMILNPSDVEFIRAMNLIYLRLAKDGCLDDYTDLLNRVVTPMVDNAERYAKAYDRLRECTIVITPDHPDWKYQFDRAEQIGNK